MYRIVCDIRLYVVITNLCEGLRMCFSAVGCCCTVQLSVCSSTVHVLALCLNVSVTFRSSKYARLLLVLNSTGMLQTSCFTAQHRRACTTQYSKQAQRGNWSSSSEAGGSLSQDVFNQMGAHRASDVPFDRTRWKGRRNARNPAEYKEGSRQCLDRRSNHHWLAFSCVGRAVYLITDCVNI